MIYYRTGTGTYLTKNFSMATKNIRVESESGRNGN